MNGHRTWALWLAGTLASFAWWERKAIQQRSPGRPSQTLTSTMRNWIGIKPRKFRRFLLVPAFTGFCTWLIAHFVGGFGA